MTKTIKASTLESMVDAYIDIYEENDVYPKKSDVKVCEDFKKINKPNILYVINDDYDKEVMYATLDIMRNISQYYNIYLLKNDNSTINIYEYIPKKHDDVIGLFDNDFTRVFKFIQKWYLKNDFTLYFNYNAEYKTIYKRVLCQYNINVIHIEHMAYHTMDLMKIAYDKGINTILSLHDLYYICPTRSIVDDEYMNYNENNPQDDYLNSNVVDVMSDVLYPDFKVFKPIWNKWWNKALQYPNHIIAPSQVIYDIYTETYPSLKDKIQVIEHGYDISMPSVDDIILPQINENEPIRILIPGNISLEKGIKFIYELKKQDKENRLELHFMGVNETKYNIGSLGRMHGGYKRENFKNKVKSINPHFIGLFSLIPEAYSYILTESWSSGIPVLSLVKGAVGERIKNNSGGYIISDKPEDAYKQVIKLSEDNEKYQNIAKKIADIHIKDASTMAEEYLSIYKK